MSITKEQILDEISKMSIIEITELISMIEKKFNVSSSSNNLPITSNKNDVKEEKTEFEIILNNIGKNKISVIKSVRNALGLGLKESKDLVESCPISLKKGMNKKDAVELKETLENSGAEVELK